MKQETISSIVMLAKADPEATPEQVQHIMRACRAKEHHREQGKVRKKVCQIAGKRPGGNLAGAAGLRGKHPGAAI